MATKTDPAREVADICKQLAKPSDQPGDKHLSSIFGVEAWSREFYEIIFSITDRLDMLSKITDELDFDDDQRSEVHGHIKKVRSAFGRQPMLSTWNTKGGGLEILKGSHVAAISVLSGQVRQKVSYPKLDDEEVTDIIGQIESLISWLEDIQLSEQDFIRQALIEGLKGLKVRLEKIGWLGWGYTVQSLRDVIGAYMALERAFPNAQENTTAAAILKKTGDVVASIWEKTGHATNARERVALIGEIYGWVALARDTGIAGLLTGP